MDLLGRETVLQELELLDVNGVYMTLLMCELNEENHKRMREVGS
jgi:hypothetical protein